ncbi:MAG: hypothetical protein MJY86_07715 [Bacteroidales bacterium]|nr:hypothetical protein [Candidatus Cryptobacteroides faecihippi]MCQ2163149.1 hypothetical protein [Bacteroidales bacterium]
MKRFLLLLTTVLALSSCMCTRNISKTIDVQTNIDGNYAFGFDLKDSRSTKGAIWNLKTGKPETPQNYSRMQVDTIDGQPVVKLYREVALGNHPLNGWETWTLKDGKWICIDSGQPAEE